MISPKWWDFQCKATAFWRLYRNEREGAFLTVAGRRVALQGGRLYLIPPRLPLAATCQYPIQHFYAHFDVAGMPEIALREMFSALMTQPCDPALEGLTGDVSDSLPPCWNADNPPLDLGDGVPDQVHRLRGPGAAFTGPPHRADRALLASRRAREACVPGAGLHRRPSDVESLQSDPGAEVPRERGPLHPHLHRLHGADAYTVRNGAPDQGLPAPPALDLGNDRPDRGGVRLRQPPLFFTGLCAADGPNPRRLTGVETRAPPSKRFPQDLPSHHYSPPHHLQCRCGQGYGIGEVLLSLRGVFQHGHGRRVQINHVVQGGNDHAGRSRCRAGRSGP